MRQVNLSGLIGKTMRTKDNTSPLMECVGYSIDENGFPIVHLLNPETGHILEFFLSFVIVEGRRG